MEGIVISRFMNDIDEYYIGKEKYKAKYYLKYDEMKSHGIKICSNFSNYDKDKILFELGLSVIICLIWTDVLL